jgi:hypothetical protein
LFDFGDHSYSLVVWHLLRDRDNWRGCDLRNCDVSAFGTDIRASDPHSHLHVNGANVAAGRNYLHTNCHVVSGTARCVRSEWWLFYQRQCGDLHEYDTVRGYGDHGDHSGLRSSRSDASVHYGGSWYPDHLGARDLNALQRYDVHGELDIDGVVRYGCHYLRVGNTYD